MPVTKAIFFDIGDTLVFDDPPLRERFRIAMKHVGLRYSHEAYAAAFHRGERYAVSRYLAGVPFDTPETLRETASYIVAALGIDALSDADWTRLLAAFIAVPWTRRLHPQALHLIQKLRDRGFLIGAISDWETTLPGLLQDMALAPLLDALAVSAIVGATKPNPAIFWEGLRQIGVQPAEALHIGDWYELDICGAQAIGMQTVLFDHAQRRPDAVCPRADDFDHLISILTSLPCPLL